MFNLMFSRYNKTIEKKNNELVIYFNRLFTTIINYITTIMCNIFLNTEN